MKQTTYCFFFLFSVVFLHLAKTASAQSPQFDWCQAASNNSELIVFDDPTEDNLMFEGLDGEQKIYGASGTDTLYGGAGADCLDGGPDGDGLYGDDDNDFLAGGSGDDLLLGGDGLDTLIGGSGDDYLSGGNDHDTLVGDVGDDHLSGGQGADIYLYNLGDGNDTIDDCESPSLLLFNTTIEPHLTIEDSGADRHYLIDHPDGSNRVTVLNHATCELEMAYCAFGVNPDGDTSGHWVVWVALQVSLQSDFNQLCGEDPDPGTLTGPTAIQTQNIKTTTPNHTMLILVALCVTTCLVVSGKRVLYTNQSQSNIN